MCLRIWWHQISVCLGAALTALIPLLGIILTEASVLWPLATFLYGAGIFYALAPLSRRRFLAVLYALLVLPFLLFEAAYFVSYYLQGTGFNRAFLYHFSPDVIYAGIGEYYWFLFFLLLIFVFVLSTFLVFSNLNRKMSTNYIFLGLGLFVLGLMVSPSIGSLADFLHFQAGSAESDPYVHFPELSNPSVRVDFKGTEKKNVVLIYLESIEQRYFDEMVFPGLLPELKKIKDQSLVYADVAQGAGSGYTMGGIVASQCGYPLSDRYNIEGNSFGIYEKILPLADCLGDLLQENGYYLAYMGGADKRFAGKEKFFESHGYSEVIGKNEILAKLGGKVSLNEWGIYDDTLLDLAFEKYQMLSTQPEPFLLTLLTLDTHHPRGHLSPSCNEYSEENNPILDAVHCTDFLVSNFINKIRSSPSSDRTLIVVFSDHLALRNMATSLLESSKNDPRLTFFVNFPSGYYDINNNSGTHFDVGPTLLDAMDFDIHGQMGFGSSLNQGPGYLVERFGREDWIDYENALFGVSANLWNDKLSLNGKDISFNMKYLQLSIGDRNFSLSSSGSSRTLESTVFIFDNSTLNLKKIHSFPFDRGMDNTTLSSILIENKGHLVFSISSAMNLPGFCDYNQAHPLDYCFYFGKPGSRDYLWSLVKGGFNVPPEAVTDLQKTKIDPLVVQKIEKLLEDLKSPRIYHGISPPELIAHAGGGIGSHVYTNSLEALNHNYDLGHRFFEIDFSWTQDNELVAIHDWGTSFSDLFIIEAGQIIPTKDEFMSLLSRHRMTQLSLGDVLQWANEKGDAYIVTDVKDRNSEALLKIIRDYPFFSQYVVPQVYSYAEYYEAEKLGFKRIILTLYRMWVNPKELVDFVSIQSPFAVTMHWELAQNGLAQMIKPWKIFTYAHTVNDAAIYAELRDLGVNGIYTDFLTPSDVGGSR